MNVTSWNQPDNCSERVGLKPERHRDGYFIATSEDAKLARLFEKHGIALYDPNGANSVNSVNLRDGPDQQANT
jgi:hypothetical protein